MKSLTIFGGALGIGIGFGLQAIVTNIAGGLILLFERPIKVGDMVQVNDEFGEIKKVGLRATVGVAYGTDTTKVLEILMSCADESPMVLSDPPPHALFLSFGDSSLNFELRAWIHEFNDRRTAISDLNQQINDEFNLAGIVIPFPQRDLHLIKPIVQDACFE